MRNHLKPRPRRRTEPTPQHFVGPFDLLRGATNESLVLSSCLDVMKNIYNDLDDSTRPVFLDCYRSLLAVLSHNRGEDIGSLHAISSSIPEKCSIFALSLEKKSANGQWTPADIFYVRSDSDTLSAEAAILSCLDTHGELVIAEIERTTKRPFSSLLPDLKGVIYYNAITSKYEHCDTFLSGNVRNKIEHHETILANEQNESLKVAIQESIDALRQAIPAPIPFSDIDIQLGARWVDVKYYEDFARWALTGKIYKDPQSVHIIYSIPTDDYIGEIPTFDANGWYMEGLTTESFMFAAIRGKAPVFWQKTADDRKIRDEDLCRKSERIVQEICDKWTEYINLPASANIRKELEEKYNRLFNSEVKSASSGKFQTFPGLHLENLGIPSLYDSQKDAIWMIKRNNGGVCWHEVGTGKTLIMCIAAYEMKRIGKINKPLIICLKANVMQIVDTFRKAYPQANILAPSNKEFSKSERLQLFDQIKNNDFDCIIMTHDQFCRIPDAFASHTRILQEEVDALDEIIEECRYSRFYGRMLSGLQKRRGTLSTKLFNMQEDHRKNTDECMDFSELGIDHIFVDESHVFKNLCFTTRHERVAGIGNPAGSARALRLLTAIRDIQARTGSDLCATFASGTIVSNSLTELYSIFKYLRPTALHQQNIYSFDSWAAVYCRRRTDYELDIVGRPVSKERFAEYVNLPELSRFLSQIMDYRTATMIDIDRPDSETHFESAPPTYQQSIMLDNLMKFAETSRWDVLGIQREQPKHLDKCKMLVATFLAKMTALDPRILDDCKTFTDEEGNKVRRCAHNIAALYSKYYEHKGTQFVFTDTSVLNDDTIRENRWNMQQELRRILVNEYAIPNSEIAIIGEAKSDAQRSRLFEKMNSGEVRVLIGSTSKLGTGVNAQYRAVAVHHLDIPWKPSDLEQRNGRAVRKGNMVKAFGDNKVHIYIYACERTLDSYLFSLLKNKQTFIDQLNTGSLSIRRIDDSIIGEENKAVSYAEFMSIVSGNTDLLEKAKLDAKLMNAERDRNLFYKRRNEAVSKLDTNRQAIAANELFIANAKADIEYHKDVTADTLLSIENPKEPITDFESAGRALYNKRREYFGSAKMDVGNCGTVKIAMEYVDTTSPTAPGDIKGRCDIFLHCHSGQYYPPHLDGCNTGVLNSTYERNAHFVYETLKNLTLEIAKREGANNNLRLQNAEYERQANEEWKGESEITSLRSQLEQVNRRIFAASQAS